MRNNTSVVNFQGIWCNANNTVSIHINTHIKFILTGKLFSTEGLGRCRGAYNVVGHVHQHKDGDERSCSVTLSVHWANKRGDLKLSTAYIGLCKNCDGADVQLIFASATMTACYNEANFCLEYLELSRCDEMPYKERCQIKESATEDNDLSNFIESDTVIKSDIMDNFI